jgi:trigger factor
VVEQAESTGTGNEFQILEQNLSEDILTLKVKVDREVVDRAYRKVHKALLRHVRVPGFRPGKIPLPVLTNAVGRENFAREVRKELLPEYYYNALSKTAYRPLSEVTFADEHLATGEAFSFAAKVSVLPEGKVGDYQGLKVKQAAPKPVEDDEVDKVLKERQKRYAKTRNAEDGEVKEGDFILLTFQVSIDGKEYHTLSRTNQTMIVGEDSYMPGFDANLVGKKKGEEFTFGTELPKKGLENKALHGKKAMVKGKIKSVQRVEMPALDDEFAKDIGVETFAELKKKVKAELEKEHEREGKESFTEDLKKALVDAVTVKFPESLLDREVDERLAQFKENFEGKSYKYEDYLSESSKDEKALREELREKVVGDLKLQVALDDIAGREGLNVTDEEFEQRIQLLGQALRKDPEEILESLDSSGRRVIQRQELVREKAFDRVREIVTGK